MITYDTVHTATSQTVQLKTHHIRVGCLQSMITTSLWKVEKLRGILLPRELVSSRLRATPLLQPQATAMSLVLVLPLPSRTYNEKTFVSALTFVQAWGRCSCCNCFDECVLDLSL